MSKYRWGTLYLVQPGWVGARGDSDQSVVESFDGVASSLAVAKELWRLAGNPRRAIEIDEAIDRGYVQERSLIKTEAIEELLRLLDGLDETVRSAFQLDEEGRVSPERLAELRPTATTLWLSETREGAEAYAVWEGLGQVDELRDILRRAIELGLYVAFG